MTHPIIITLIERRRFLLFIGQSLLLRIRALRIKSHLFFRGPFSSYIRLGCVSPKFFMHRPMSSHHVTDSATTEAVARLQPRVLIDHRLRCVLAGVSQRGYTTAFQFLGNSCGDTVPSSTCHKAIPRLVGLKAG